MMGTDTTGTTGTMDQNRWSFERALPILGDLMRQVERELEDVQLTLALTREDPYAWSEFLESPLPDGHHRDVYRALENLQKIVDALREIHYEALTAYWDDKQRCFEALKPWLDDDGSLYRGLRPYIWGEWGLTLCEFLYLDDSESDAYWATYGC